MVKADIWAYTKIELYKDNQRVGWREGPGEFLGRLRHRPRPALYHIRWDREYSTIYPVPERGRYVAIYSEASGSRLDQLNDARGFLQSAYGLYSSSGWNQIVDNTLGLLTNSENFLTDTDGIGSSKRLSFQAHYPEPHYDKIIVTFLAYSNDDRILPLIFFPSQFENGPYTVDYCTIGCWADRDWHDMRLRSARHHQWVRYTIDIKKLREQVANKEFFSPAKFPLGFAVYETLGDVSPFFGRRYVLHHQVDFYFARYLEKAPEVKTKVFFNSVESNPGREPFITRVATSELMRYKPSIPKPGTREGTARVGEALQRKVIRLQRGPGGHFQIDGFRQRYNQVKIVFYAESHRVFDSTRPQMKIDAVLVNGPTELQPHINPVSVSSHLDQYGLQYQTEGSGGATVTFDPSTIPNGTYQYVLNASQELGPDGHSWVSQQFLEVIIQGGRPRE